MREVSLDLESLEMDLESIVESEMKLVTRIKEEGRERKKKSQGKMDRFIQILFTIAGERNRKINRDLEV